MLAITALTTADVIVAKAVFDDHDAGIYGSASLVGRVILYLPAAIVTVLLPKVSARTTRGEATGDILAASLGVTLAASALLTLVYAAVPDLVVRLAFGSAYEDASSLLYLFGIAMSGYALLNVLLIYHLARNTDRDVVAAPRRRGAPTRRVHAVSRLPPPTARRQHRHDGRAPGCARGAHRAVADIGSRQARSSLMSFARLWNRTAARYSIVLGGFLVVTVLWTMPLVAHLGSSVFVEPSDAHVHHARLLGDGAPGRVAVHVRATTG